MQESDSETDDLNIESNSFLKLQNKMKNVCISDL